MTIKEALASGEHLLKNASDAPRIDAERLLLHTLKQPENSWLYSHSLDTLSPVHEAAFKAGINRRHNGEPLAYILGFQEFYGRTYLVAKDVLIPRASTETLIDKSLEVIHNIYIQISRPLLIADIGTGSGCIAITLALENPSEISKIFAIDISKAALEIAQKNIKHFNVEQKVSTLLGDMLGPLANMHIDLIVSNPPYVPSLEIKNINPSNSDTAGLLFEPKNALDGGLDGQKYIRIIKASDIPAVLEGTEGDVMTANIRY